MLKPKVGIHLSFGVASDLKGPAIIWADVLHINAEVCWATASFQLRNGAGCPEEVSPMSLRPHMFIGIPLSIRQIITTVSGVVSSVFC